jgi:hypothetical protein
MATIFVDRSAINLTSDELQKFEFSCQFTVTYIYAQLASALHSPYSTHHQAMQCSSAAAAQSTASVATQAAETGAVQAKPEPLDYSNVNALITEARQRLAGGIGGSFFEIGSKLEEDKRIGQLPCVFKLLQELESLKQRSDKLRQRSEMDEDKQSKSLGKPNKNEMANIRNIVEQQIETRFRDLKIQSERVEAGLKKEIESLKKSQRDEERKGKVGDVRTKTMEGKIKVLEGKQDAIEANENASLNRMETRITASEADTNRLRDDHLHGMDNTKANLERLDRWIDKTAETINKNTASQQRRLSALEDWKASTTARPAHPRYGGDQG